MDSEINVQVTISVDFETSEMNLLRTAANQDYVEPMFHSIPDELTYEELVHLRDSIVTTIEWGDYDESEIDEAVELHDNLDSLCISIEQDDY